MTDSLDKTIETIRVSYYDQFVVVTRYKDNRYPPMWGYWDLSGSVARLLASGRGDPPDRLFPASGLYSGTKATVGGA